MMGRVFVSVFLRRIERGEMVYEQLIEKSKTMMEFRYSDDHAMNFAEEVVDLTNSLDLRIFLFARYRLLAY